MITESVNSILARQDQNQQAAAGAEANIVDKDGFLKLLIAQMQNQDPLSPMDNTEFLSQMAQFSELEQLQNINGNLTSSLQWDLLFNQTINNTMATSLIGREVEAFGDEIVLGENGAAKVRYELSAFAKDVSFEVLDSEGNTVYSEQKTAVDAGSYSWEWDGRGDNGTRLPAGTYQFRITALDTDGGSVNTRAYRTGIVTGVQYIDGAAYLTVGGQTMSLADVQSINLAEAQ
jgi:flagellar basal-body rod modification protein FlgD